MPDPTPTPDTKRCIRCGRTGTRAYKKTPAGPVCINRDACTDRQLNH